MKTALVRRVASRSWLWTLERGSRAVFVLAAAWHALAPTVARAQYEAPGVTTGKAYVNQYIITLVLIGMAMFVLCRPSRRTDKIRSSG